MDKTFNIPSPFHTNLAGTTGRNPSNAQEEIANLLSNLANAPSGNQAGGPGNMVSASVKQVGPV